MIITDFRKKDLKGKIHTLGFLKGVFTCSLSVIAMRTQNDKWCKPVHKVCMDFLQKKYWNTGLYKTDAMDELTFGDNGKSDKTNIWIFWYQGWENAPQIVKDCRVTTEKYLTNEKYNVHYLTKDNYTSFVKFPKWIVDKVSAGTLDPTKFSDLLRAALLYGFGGIWMDATIFLTKPVDEKIKDYPYYTIRRLPEHPMFCISRHQWSSFFMATNTSKTLFYKELLILQTEYWRREGGAMDFLLIDYQIALILRNHPDMAKEWENIPENNIDLLFIEHSLNSKYDPDKWEEIKKRTGIFKLTYKIPLSDDPDTYYNRIINSKK